MCGAGSGRQTFDEELREGNEAEDIRRKHCVDVLILYMADGGNAEGAAGVVNCRDGFRNMRSKTRQVETEVGELTEDVDVAEVLRYFGPQLRHLGSICDVELHDGDLPALLYARGLVRGGRSLCDFRQLVGAAREEDQVCAPLVECQMI
jgi:hypothetical protein